MKIVTKYKSAFWLAVIVLVFFIFGKIFFGIYEASPRDVVDIQQFQKVFNEKEKQARQTISILEEKIEHNNMLDSLKMIDFQGNDIIYYVYKNNRIVFWSNNLIVQNNGIEFQENTTKYIKMPNNNCVYVCRARGNIKIVALILIKFSYSAETATLRNCFVRDFRTNANVLVTQGNANDIYAVRDSSRSYLFSLQMPLQPIFSNIWLIISHVAFLFFFIAFYIACAMMPKLAGKKNISPATFLITVLLFGLATFLIMYYRVPDGFFDGAALVFEGFRAGNVLNTPGMIVILTFYCVSTLYLLNFVNTAAFFRKYKYAFLIGQLVFFACFLLFNNILHNIVSNSASQISVLKLEDFTLSRFLLHTIFCLWGLGFIFLFFKLFVWVKTVRHYLIAAFVNTIFLIAFFALSDIFHWQFALLTCISFAVLLTLLLFFLYHTKNLYIYSNMLNAMYIFVVAGIIATNIFYFEKENRINNFRKIAQNILSENVNQTHLQSAQLVEMNTQIAADQTLRTLLKSGNLPEDAERYFEEKYLTNNLSNYESTIFVYQKKSTDYSNYINLINEYGSQITQSAFYQISAPQSANSFVGIFNLYRDSLYFVVNLEPVRGFSSYSFPNLLIDSDKNKKTNLQIATAKYTSGSLTASAGRFAYPATTAWLSTVKLEKNNFLYNGRSNLILWANDAENVAVVTDLQNHNWGNYFIYFLYGFLICFLVIWLFVWLLSAINHKQLKISIISRFQHLFFVLFLLSFLGVFTISSEMFKRRYRDQQIASVVEKMTYIQKVLQEKYFYNLTLTNSESDNLNDDLKDISYTFQTDIHVYDNNGLLIATTQPIIFNKNLISRRISPNIFFTDKTTLSEIEQIGALNYLVNYSEFFNGDNLQIGYIAIPQYFSAMDINSELLSFFKFIVHIYVVALIIALIFSNIIRKQLAKPLVNLENKLHAMQLGNRNEKIEYKSNDEISQLVEQYNITVDKLDRSARLLAKSERESAWKLMARQIAHEINNPLTPMKLSIQQLQRTKKMGSAQFDDYFDKSTKILVEQIDNLSHIASTFSNFAKLPEAKFERTNLTEKIGSVVELFKNNDKGVHVSYLFYGKEIYVFADPEQLQQVFSNLIKNAIQAIPEQPQKLVEVKLQNIGNKAVIEVTDNGTGIAPEIADKLFVPSFTTKSTGTGLGLAISKNIVETADGTISFTSKTGEGTTFRVEFPTISI